MESYTHGTTYEVTVSKKFLGRNDRVLIIDDFLANGKALEGLIAICRQAGAEVVGAGVAVEKLKPVLRNRLNYTTLNHIIIITIQNRIRKTTANAA